MKRVTEPELMRDKKQVKAYVEADFSLTEENLVEQLSQELRKKEDFCSDSLIIDLGCGPGNISEKISSRWKQVRVIGVDDSEEMLKEAIKRSKLGVFNVSSEKLSYKQENISSIANGKSTLINCADVVVSNSVFHHIHEPSVFFHALLNISKNGALHFHRDLRRPSTYEKALAIQNKYLKDAPSIIRRDFLASLLAAHTSEEVNRYFKKFNFNHFSVTEVEDKYIDIIGTIHKP